MTNVVIVSTARTPLAKSWKGAFNMTHGATLGGHAVQHAVARAGAEHFVHLAGPDAPLPAEGTISIVGPGTGLGVAHIWRGGTGA